MSWFGAFRNEYGFASYSDNRTPVTYDIPLLTVTYLCVLVSIATLIATLGIRGRERWSFTIRAMYAVGIGSIILACLVGYAWQEGSVKITSHYVYRNNLPFEGQVGVRVALSAVNVTLDGFYRGASGPGYVFYAESMPWSDFGHESERYGYFLYKGLPAPILKVMEFLTVDEGALRWGRSFHTSGHYAMALLWTSFAFWIVSNVLLCSVIVYGAYMFTLTGLTMILACVTYHVCQCSLPLVISFGEQNLTMSYSWCYWLTLTAGCLTLLLGLLLIITDQLAHAGLSDFFHLEKLTLDDVFEIDIRQTDTPQDSFFRKDRRGSLVPPPSDRRGERRGSIFLDESRQPGHLSDKLKLSFLPTTNFFNSKSPDSVSKGSKVNPLYSEDGTGKASTFENHEEDVRVQMERVCEDWEVCLSTKKPSLATLKEHRENHANERLSSGSDKPTNRYVRQTQQSRRVSYQDGVFPVEKSDKPNTVPQHGRRRGSCPSNVYADHLREPSICETSESDVEEDRQPSSSHEVVVSIESGQSSGEDSSIVGSPSIECTPSSSSLSIECTPSSSSLSIECTPSSSSKSVECTPSGSSQFVEYSSGGLEEKNNLNESESGVGSRNDSQSSCDADHDDVIVNIPC